MAAVRLIYLHYSTYRHTLLQTSISASTDRSVGKSKGTEFLMQFWAMFMAPGGQLEPFTVLPEIKKQKTNKHWCYTVYNFLPFFSGVSANIAPCFNYCIIQSILFESPFFSEINDCLCEILSWYLRFFFGIYCQIKENLHQCMD